MFLNCLGVERKQHMPDQFKKRRNSLRGNFVTKYETPIENDYDIESTATLGKGAYGVVLKGVKKISSRSFAIKFISKTGHLARIEREIKLLTDIDHANIVRLFSVYDSELQVAFVLDLCTGGDLNDLVKRSYHKFLSEADVKILIRQLVSAVTHLHSRGICHRDIKLQNILLENMDDRNAQIKLIDFGFATRFVGVTPLKTRCGTPYTTAPEVFRECYDERCDVWSVGVVCYYLLCGHRPFASVNLPGELKKAGKASIVTSILMGRYHFNHAAFKNVSAEGIHFVQRMLAPNYRSRWHAKDALNCNWLTKAHNITAKYDFATLKNKDTPLSLAVANLCKRTNFSNLGNTGMVAVAFDHTNHDAPEIRTMFHTFDTENAGFLSKHAFRKAMKSVSPDLTDEEIDQLFQAIDVDNDSQISFTEFLAATMDPREVDLDELSKAFKLLDSDNKGYLTVDDFYRVLAVTPNKYRGLQLSNVARPHLIDSQKKNQDSNSSDEVSKSGVQYFDDTNNDITEKNDLLRKIALMIKSADVNNDGVLSYSEFLLGIIGQTDGGSASADEAGQKYMIPTDEDLFDVSALAKGAERIRIKTILNSTKNVQPQPIAEAPVSSPNADNEKKSFFGNFGFSKAPKRKTTPTFGTAKSSSNMKKSFSFSFGSNAKAIIPLAQIESRSEYIPTTDDNNFNDDEQRGSNDLVMNGNHVIGGENSYIQEVTYPPNNENVLSGGQRLLSGVHLDENSTAITDQQSIVDSYIKVPTAQTLSPEPIWNANRADAHSPNRNAVLPRVGLLPPLVR